MSDDTKLFMAVVAGVIIIAITPFIFKWLWNWLMPDIFGLQEISYWQAIGLIALSRSLFCRCNPSSKGG